MTDLAVFAEPFGAVFGDSGWSEHGRVDEALPAEPADLHADFGAVPDVEGPGAYPCASAVVACHAAIGDRPHQGYVCRTHVRTVRVFG